jgi:hypothetical protein
VATSLDFDLETEVRSLKQEPSWMRGDRNARTLVEEHPGAPYRLTSWAGKIQELQTRMPGRMRMTS